MPRLDPLRNARLLAWTPLHSCATIGHTCVWVWAASRTNDSVPAHWWASEGVRAILASGEHQGRRWELLKRATPLA